MKFVHIIAEVLLHLMQEKWNTYMYLESDTTSGNFEARIMKFIVTRRPLQFTHCTEKRFLRHCFWKSIVTFTPIHFKTLSYTWSYVAFSAVHC